MRARRTDICRAWPNREELGWLMGAGVTPASMTMPAPIMVANGSKARDGLFDESHEGERWFAFEEDDDLVFWHRGTGQMAAFENRVFALGQDTIGEAATYAFDCSLNIFADPLDWLRSNRDGIVVLNWALAFDRLRDAPRIAVAERVLPAYRRHMRPARMPELFVIPNRRQAA